MLEADGVAVAAHHLDLRHAGSDAAFELFRRSRRRSAAGKNGHDLTLASTRALSKRERQVLDHLVRGRTNKQIAHRLGVTDHSEAQVTRIYEKLEVRNRLDLLTLAIERGGRRVALAQGRPRVAPIAVQSAVSVARVALRIQGGPDNPDG